VLRKCRAGYTHAIIGGSHKCLHVGQLCAKRHVSQYRRYGFGCRRGGDGRYRLYRRR